ncbi:MAG: 2TM domain-containing protein [Sediminibacterium sp.]
MQTNDEILWRIAKKRARFKKQLISYVLVSCFLWGIWFMSGSEINYDSDFPGFPNFPWPAWIMFWWGIGLVFCFVNAYLVNTPNAVENEYQKLKNQQ